MTIKQLLDIDASDNKKRFGQVLTAIVKETEFKDRLVQLTLVDNSGTITMAVWKNNQDDTPNPHYKPFALLDKGQQIHINNGYCKPGYKGGPNEFGIQKNGTMKVLGTAEVPTPAQAPVPEEDPNAFDNLIEGARGNGAQQKTPQVKKSPKSPKSPPSPSGAKGYSSTGIPFDPVAFMGKMDDIKDAVLGLTRTIETEAGKTRQVVLQQFKEFMSKFIESSNVTPEDITSPEE